MVVLYIILGILAVLALLIAVTLSLPLKLYIKYSEDKGFDFNIKFLFYTFGNEESEDFFPEIFYKITKNKKTGTKKVGKQSVSKKGLSFTVKEVFELVKSILTRIVPFLKSFVITRLELNIVCADADNTSDAATDYGKVCAIVYPVLGFIHSNLKVKKRKERISISCDYLAEKPSFSLDTVLSVRIFRIISSFMPTIKTVIKQFFKKFKK